MKTRCGARFAGLGSVVRGLFVGALSGIAGLMAIPAQAADGPSLFVGVIPPGEVLQYDGATGEFLSVFVPAGSGGLIWLAARRLGRTNICMSAAS